VKDGLGLLEGDRVFLQVRCCFERVPFEADHQYSVLTCLGESRASSPGP
jgi:hypothetical protein